MAAALVLLDPSLLGAEERRAIDWGHQILCQRQARARALDAAWAVDADEAAADDQAGQAAADVWV
eukprot:13245535-Heterocapsa_arctica.AAC.1